MRYKSAVVAGAAERELAKVHRELEPRSRARRATRRT